MTRPIYASGLLKTAKKLAGVDAGRGRPALADLRRATSTAYYALFHQIVRHGSFVFLPGGTEPEVAEVARWFTHTGVLSAATLVTEAASVRGADRIKKPYRTGVLALRSAAMGAIPGDLVTVADAFRSLQEARHGADYDGNYDPVRAVTINHVQDAEAAVKATWSMWLARGSSNPDRRTVSEAYVCFLRLALLQSGPPKGR